MNKLFYELGRFLITLSGRCWRCGDRPETGLHLCAACAELSLREQAEKDLLRSRRQAATIELP